MKPAADPSALTYREAAERMGISMATFYRLKARGVFDRARIFAPIAERISAERLDAWLATRDVQRQAATFGPPMRVARGLKVAS